MKNNILQEYERRKHQRFGVNYSAKIKDNSNHILGTIIDISEYGMGVRASEHLSKNEKINIEFEYHMCFGNRIINKNSLHLNVKVIWLRHETPYQYRYGLQITERCHVTLHKLKNLIQLLLFIKHQESEIQEDEAVD